MLENNKINKGEKLTSESKYKDLEIDMTDIYSVLETIYKEKKSMNFDIRLHQIQIHANMKFHCDKCNGMDDKKGKNRREIIYGQK